MPTRKTGPGGRKNTKVRKKTCAKPARKSKILSRKGSLKRCPLGKVRKSKTKRCVNTLKTKMSKCKAKGKTWQSGKCYTKPCVKACQYRSKTTHRCRNFVKRKECCKDNSCPVVHRKFRSRRIR